jgi:putative phosphoribosyl transferase
MDASRACAEPTTRRDVRIPGPGDGFEGELAVPADAHGLVVFAHGSGSSRHSPRNHAVAGAMETAGFATLLFDLLTKDEEARDRWSGEFRFDVGLLASRLLATIEWAATQELVARLPFGLFGASTGAAAAMVAAANRPELVRAVVSRGGRPDLAGEALDRVRAPTLLVVGERDETVIELNREAYMRLRGERTVRIVPGATHLFEEPGALEEVAVMAAEWFSRWLRAAEGRA